MPFLFIALGTLMWSLDTLIRYPLLGVISAEVIVFIEHLFLIGYFIPLLFIHKFDFKSMTIKSIGAFLVIGMLGSAVSTLAFTHAFSLINPSLVILLQKLQPLVAITLSALILKEKIKRNFFLYGAAAFAGAFLISYQDISPLFNSVQQTANLNEQNLLLGYSLTLLAVIGWGASTVFGKQLANDGFKEYEIMSGRFVFGFVFLFAYSALKSAWPPPSMTLESYLKILLMVFISGLLGMYFYYKGLKKISAHQTAIAELFFPLSAVTINWIFLGKTLTLLQIIGAVTLIGSTALLQKSSKNQDS